MASSISARLRAGVSTGSAEETQALAAALAAELPADATLALHGDLGAGKTTFVQGLARGLGVAEPVTSPTFNLYRLYAPAPGGRQLAHLDAYRLDGAAQAEALLLEDFLLSPYCLAVEWPEKIAAWIPANAWHLDLALAAGGRRALRLR
ncbi:MAG TPA: tRNA (adenosine(37)-N6)-threonylcarbamoyltransferase complex ATPase subunit type 1 TsaE [Opitutaceae bacterium]|nr:tRNA (adenosine(37)-N6)-threonylcarbamoyltransferase complex ATPase subunit type 1 TsaE [Opitutaceae bacterium]